MIWGGIDLVWHIIHIVFMIVIGLSPFTWWFYFDLLWYTVMIIMDILVIVGASKDVRQFAQPLKFLLSLQEPIARPEFS